MKLSESKAAGAFKRRANSSSSKWNPPISAGSSPTAGSPKGAHTTMRRLKVARPSGSSIELNNIGSPSSGGYYSPTAQWELDQIFKRFDKNGDRKISCNELGSILRRLGESPTDEEVVKMLNCVDGDGDGFISLDELDRLSLVESAAAAADLVDAFNVFDTNRDGKISVYELHRVFAALGDECTLEDCLRMINKVDRDGDGYVSFDEFVCMMTR